MIGVECSHGFGDCLFNNRVIESLFEKYGKVDVAVKHQHADAFTNSPHVNKVVFIDNMYDGMSYFVYRGYDVKHQLTQNHWFPIFKSADDNHSLIDTPSLVAQTIGLSLKSQKPLIYLSDDELKQAGKIVLPKSKKVFALEAVANSGQSWSKLSDWVNLAEWLTGRGFGVVWLSNVKAPEINDIVDLSDVSRRVAIGVLGRCDHFVTTGSGMFCANLALEIGKKSAGVQAPIVSVIWSDSYYRYVDKLNKLGWTKKPINWLLSQDDINAWLAQL